MKIALPWPHKHLSPNARVHWAQKAKQVKLARAFTYGLTLDGRVTARLKPAITVTYTFHPADKRRRDLDNLIASTKASTDGISQALGVDDSTFKLAYALGEIRKPAFVEVVIA